MIVFAFTPIFDWLKFWAAESLKLLRPVDLTLMSNWCRYHTAGQWCPAGCNATRRVCHKYARGQQCMYADSSWQCRYVHLSLQKPFEEQPPKPKARPRRHAMHKPKSKATPKRQAVSAEVAEALSVLGLDPATNKRQIVANYRREALVYHPDKAAQQAEEKMQKAVQQAEAEMQKDVQWAETKMRRLNNAKDLLASVYP